jgi:hypothetical protein
MLICSSRFEVMSGCVGEAQNLLHWTIGLWCTYVYVLVGVVSMLMYHLMSVGEHLINIKKMLALVVKARQVFSLNSS